MKPDKFESDRNIYIFFTRFCYFNESEKNEVLQRKMNHNPVLDYLFMYIHLYVIALLIDLPHHRFIQAHNIVHYQKWSFVFAQDSSSIFHIVLSNGIASASIGWLVMAYRASNKHKSNTDSNYVIIDGNSHFHFIPRTDKNNITEFHYKVG